MMRGAVAAAALLATACGARTELRASVDASAGGAVSLCGIEADSGGGACGSMPNNGGLSCCSGNDANLDNDPLNCGACGQRCAPSEMCLHGKCQAPVCAPSCGPCQVCCLVVGGGPAMPPSCIDGPTCPVGCPWCTREKTS